MSSLTPESLRRRRLERTLREAPRPIDTQPPAVHQAIAPLPKPNGRTDILLLRGASISQVILSLATILGFWFTVIPLYQKAALDEQLAKEEIDLKTAQAGVVVARREAYEQHRSNSIAKFAVMAGDKCAGLVRTFGTDADSLDAIRVQNAEWRAKIMDLDVDIAHCLVDAAAQDKDTQDLPPGDQAFLLSTLIKLGGELDAHRLAVKQQIADLPLKASYDPSVLDPPSAFMAEAYKQEDYVAHALHSEVPPSKLQARKTYAIEKTQERLARDHRQRSFATIVNRIRGISWPNSPPSQPAK